MFLICLFGWLVGGLLELVKFYAILYGHFFFFQLLSHIVWGKTLNFMCIGISSLKASVPYELRNRAECQRKTQTDQKKEKQPFFH